MIFLENVYVLPSLSIVRINATMFVLNRTRWWIRRTISDQRWCAPRRGSDLWEDLCRSWTIWTCWDRESCWSWLAERHCKINGRSTRIVAFSRASARDRYRTPAESWDPAWRITANGPQHPTGTSGPKRTNPCSASRKTIERWEDASLDFLLFYMCFKTQ